MMKKEMNNSTDVKRMHVLSIVLLIALLVGSLAVVPSVVAFGVAGVVIPIICFAVALPCAFILEDIKKKNKVQTYSEIVAFMNGEKIDEKKAKIEPNNWINSSIAKVIFGGVLGLILGFIGVMLFLLI